MYCSSCGAAVQPDLSYCNRCGAELVSKERSANKQHPSQLPPGLLVCAIVVVTTVGLGSILAMLQLLRQSPQLAGEIMVFSVFMILLILAIEILFIWLLLRPSTDAKGAADLNQLRGTALRELDPGQKVMLPQSSFSVTEHTTRTLEPIQSQPKAE